MEIQDILCIECIEYGEINLDILAPTLHVNQACDL